MAFMYDNSSLKRLDDYDAALKHWASIKPLRGHNETDPKPIEKRNKMHVTIRKLDDGSIACKLHHTDVVIYHPDSAVTLNCYSSVSTNEFAGSLLPHDVSANFTGGYARLGSWEDGRFYKIGSTIKISNRNGWTVDNLKPWSVPVVDKVKAREALKTSRYSEFKSWWEMRDKMEGVNTAPAYMRYTYKRRDVAQMLASGPEAWGEVDRTRASQVYQWAGLRQQIQKDAGAVSYQNKDYLIGWPEMASYIRAIRKWGSS